MKIPPLAAACLTTLVAVLPPAARAVGDFWQGASPVIASENLNAIAGTGSRFVAVGQHGLVATSTTGTSWSLRSIGTSEALNGITWTGAPLNLLVVVGDNGTVRTSPDGLVWTARISPVRMNWRTVAWNGTRLIVTGDGGASMVSTDGVTWTQRSTGTFEEWRGTASAGGITTITGSDGAICTSSDGLVWSTISPPTSAWLHAVASSGSKWVAVGDSGVVYTSPDANTWSVGTSGVSVTLRAVLWTGSQFVAAGDAGTIITSSDGTTWTVRSTGTAVLYGLGVSGGVIAAVGENGRLLTSPDGIAWTDRSAGSHEWQHDAAWTGSQWVAVGAGGAVQTSPDGLTWTQRNAGTTASLNGIAWNGSTLCAVAETGTAYTSSDGISWTARSTGGSSALLAITAAGSQFIAVGRSGSVAISADNGASWTRPSSGTSNHLRAVNALGGTVAAAGDNGTIITSASNGASWTLRSSGVTTDLNGIAVGSSGLVATGEWGRVLTSATGSSWSIATALLTGDSATTGRSVHWTGTEFVLVGSSGSIQSPAGFMMNSLTGTSWLARKPPPTGPLNAVVTGGGKTLALGDGGAILMEDSASLPVVQFSAASASVAEAGGTQLVTLSLSAPQTYDIQVGFTRAGTATSGVDVNVPTSPVTIPAGQTSATLTLVIISDNLDEPDETVSLTLTGALGATLGAQTTTVITILDDDTAPVISLPPQGDLVPLGTAVTFTAAASGGEPITRSWLKDNKVISGAAQSTYTIPSATLAHAGSYVFRARNPSAAVDSAPAPLGVVDISSKTTTLLQNKVATLSITAAGPGLTYQWSREGLDLVDGGRISGAQTAKLTITSLTGADGGTYRCTVSNAARSLLGGAQRLYVTVPPVIEAPNFGTLRVSQSVFAVTPSANSPTSFTISGLPSGLTYSKTTGIITGRPLAPANVIITIKATNAAGSAQVTAPLLVLGLATGTNGSYEGLVERVSGLSSSSVLGGRCTLIVSSTGSVSGTVALGTSTYRFVKPLDTSADASVSTLSQTILRTGLPALQLELALDPGTGVASGTLSDGLLSTPVTVWRAMAAPFSSWQGYHTAALSLALPADINDPAIPQGHGFASFTVGSTGSATGTLKLADGTALTLSSKLTTTAAIVLYRLLYGSTGSLHGTLDLISGIPVLVATSGLTWSKAVQASSSVRSYRAGFPPLELAVTGARYTPPGPTAYPIIMNLPASQDDVPNVAVVFANGGAPDPVSRLNIASRYTGIAVLDPQTPVTNPGRVALAFTPSSGLFSGSFTLQDRDTGIASIPVITRTTAFSGVIARDSSGVLRGYGFFNLAGMPDHSVSPATTILTSPLLSGSVELSPMP